MDDFWKKCEEQIGARETLSLRARVARKEMTELEARTYMLKNSRKPLETRLRAAGVSLSTPPDPPAPPERDGQLKSASGYQPSQPSPLSAHELTYLELKFKDQEVLQFLEEHKILPWDIDQIFRLAQLGIATRNRGNQ